MHKPDTYLTIAAPSRGVYREKGSRFMAFAYPVNTEEEITAHLDALRKTHHDARHHCYAWKLGPRVIRYRINDDGEPGHSAGKPILGQIESLGLQNVLVVVVRYFGGTLLGVGGLIRAYRNASAEALTNAKIVQALLTRPIRVEYPYARTREIMRLIDAENLDIRDQRFTEICSMILQIPDSQRERLLKQLNALDGVKAGRVED